MQKRPVTSKAWPPEGYVDPRRLQKPPRDYRGAIVMFVTFVCLMSFVFRTLRGAHLAVARAATDTAAPGAQPATVAFFNVAPLAAIVIAVVLAFVRLRR